jgi:hypothetical protein
LVDGDGDGTGAEVDGDGTGAEKRGLGDDILLYTCIEDRPKIETGNCLLRRYSAYY